VSTGVAVLLGVRPERVGALRAAVAALGPGDASPVAALGLTHMARFVVVEERFPDGPCLLFSAEADAEAGAYLRHVAERLDAARPVWALCDGCPDPADAAALAAWLEGHRVRSGFSVRPYRRATVDDVRTALDLRARLAAFAARTQDLEPVALQRAWREEFG
jgi:hypothetical protein